MTNTDHNSKRKSSITTIKGKKTNNVNSFFRYPGGKRKLIEDIHSKMEAISGSKFSYREPFFGGGSVGLYVLKNSNVTSMWLNDRDIGIYCLWKSVINYPSELKEWVNSFVPSVDAFFDFRKELLDISRVPTKKLDIVKVGFYKLAIHQISYSGLGTKSGGPLGGVEQKSKYHIGCRWSGKYICEKIDKLHATFQQIPVTCTCLDFEEVVSEPSREMDNVLIYLDPPYYDKGNVLYQYGFTENDHVRLSNRLKSCKFSWLLSYDDCPETRKMYSWATCDTCKVNYSITTARTKQELLIHL